MLQAVRDRLSEEERYLADQRSQGRGWAELANELNVEPDALRMRFRRALERIRSELGPDFWTGD
jgi:DNA-directed RNA polymerase specialized sigma24 family protein